MAIAILYLHVQIPGCTSLKQKRSTLHSLLANIHKSFNVSASEYSLLDSRDESILACAIISNDATHNRQVMDQIENRIFRERPDIEIIDSKIEFI